MTGAVRSRQGFAPDPLLAMMRGGAVPGLAAGLVTVAVSAAWGPRAVAGAAVGAAVALVVLWAGPSVVAYVSTRLPGAALAAALSTYASTVVALGVAFVVLAPQPWLSPDHTAAALLAVPVAWLAGQLRAFVTLRVPAFDVPLPPAATDEPLPGQGGSPGSSLPERR